MKILLIGGTRFLGRYIASDLAARGHEVVIMNRGTRPPHEAAARSIKCDISDHDAFGKVLTSERWEGIIDTILSAEDLEFVIETLKGKIKHFVHTGSIGVYAPLQQIPSRENEPLVVHDAPFSFGSKLQQDQVLMRAHNENGFPATSLRMSYIYGPGAVPLDGWGGRSPIFFQKLRDGETIPLADDGRVLLHPGDVGDLARSFGDALETPRSIGQIYNIGGSHALMMKDYIRLIAELMGVTPSLEYVTPQEILARFPDITNARGMAVACEHMCCDISKAERDLGWHPQTRLDVGFGRNIAWMREQGQL
jgi:nucleoside-diphosphate-sugar epimerase